MAASAQAPPSLLMTELRFSNTGQRGHKKLWVNVMICTEDVANVCRHAIPRQEESGNSLLNVLDRFHSEDEEITMDGSQNGRNKERVESRSKRPNGVAMDNNNIVVSKNQKLKSAEAVRRA
ncbi:hypothetical protein IGI04_002055 [Brassica rapa subsp. trilocularis]|uniref:Uncharacterized protein n=1 Tax=Brassica rapa subsp. trilocularis TaxID=1813537 RepID=A0ABQ7NUD7_BRACM|nr:hypothetical protein IGI04_002055 [Brassica rapa subsp. trilocularis]